MILLPRAVRADIFASLNVTFLPRDFAKFLIWLIRLKKSWQTKAVIRTAAAAMLYQIWRHRNDIMFNKLKPDISSVVNAVKEAVRIRFEFLQKRERSIKTI